MLCAPVIAFPFQEKNAVILVHSHSNDAIAAANTSENLFCGESVLYGKTVISSFVFFDFIFIAMNLSILQLLFPFIPENLWFIGKSVF